MKQKEKINIAPVKNVWVCAGKDGVCDFSTLSYWRRDSIFKFANDSKIAWKEWRKWGWVCIKVDLTLNHIVK